jgi:hypothetical protein
MGDCIAKWMNGATGEALGGKISPRMAHAS